ncbi:MAG TPA: hypothetical protein VMH48_11250 [Methylomirabilota bacterium]|nr:hypothetical protein [Methylomirabilota bacterium]
MLFGHNTNVSVAGKIFHVQTEDRGASHALIDTAVYFRGRVLHRRTKNYSDLLPLDADREHALKLRVDEQHRAVVEDLRSGRLNLTVPENEKPPAPKAVPAAEQTANVLRLDLLNPKTWLTGNRAFLQIAVRDPGDKAVEAAKVIARVEGAAQPVELSSETGPFGHAQFEFDMPRLAGGDVALVIECSKGTARGHLRFHLRAKPQTPRAS